jgi:hypothetical protein
MRNRFPRLNGSGSSRLLAYLAGAALLLLSWGEEGLGQFDKRFAIDRYRLDEENFLDFKAYQPTSAWRYEWIPAPNGLRASIGSLSRRKFYFFDEIRLEKELGRYATFLYSQQEDALFRPDPTYREAEFRIGRGVYASLIGFPQHDKVAGDEGLALAWGRRTDWNYIRISRLEQFVLYNQWNQENRRFGPTPYLDRLEVRQRWGGQVLLELDLRVEEPARLISPDEGKEETYRGRKLDLRLDWKRPDGSLLGINLNGNREERRRLPDQATLDFPALEQTLEWGWIDIYGGMRLAGGDTVEFGGFSGRFENRIAGSAGGVPVEAQAFRHRLGTDLTYLTWQRPVSPWFQWLFSFLLGRARLDERAGDAPEAAVAHDGLEVKLGVGVLLMEEGSYRLLFNSTWDLDLFLARQWDGGNVQLQLLF